MAAAEHCAASDRPIESFPQVHIAPFDAARTGRPYRSYRLLEQKRRRLNSANFHSRQFFRPQILFENLLFEKIFLSTNETIATNLFCGSTPVEKGLIFYPTTKIKRNTVNWSYFFSNRKKLLQSVIFSYLPPFIWRIKIYALYLHFSDAEMYIAFIRNPVHFLALKSQQFNLVMIFSLTV